MNILRKIKSLKGDEVSMSYPSQKELDNLPKTENGNPDISKLPKETVGNVVLNCIANYPVKDKKEIIYIHQIGNLLLANDNESDLINIELKDKLREFLIDVVNYQTYSVEKDEKSGKDTARGMYMGWVAGQVLDELGVKE